MHTVLKIERRRTGHNMHNIVLVRVYFDQERTLIGSDIWERVDPTVKPGVLVGSLAAD